MYHNDKKYALTNCILLDGSEHMEPQTGKAVCIDGEKINEIVDAQHIPAGYEAVDLGVKYVLPGLINMHVHLPASGKLAPDGGADHVGIPLADVNLNGASIVRRRAVVRSFAKISSMRAASGREKNCRQTS